MKQLNVPVEDAVYEAAKQAAASRGMLLRKVVEHALIMYCDVKIKPESPARERHLVDFGEL